MGVLWRFMGGFDVEGLVEDRRVWSGRLIRSI